MPESEFKLEQLVVFSMCENLSILKELVVVVSIVQDLSLYMAVGKHNHITCNINIKFMFF